MNDPVAQSTQKIQEGIVMAHDLIKLATEYSVKYGFQVLGGIVILFIGFKLASWAAKLFTNFLLKKNLDVTLTKFLANILKVAILVFVVLMAVEKFGVTISPLIAAASALIFGASFAIQAPLSNYAAGLMVILTRPFVVGNTIQVQGVSGIVEEVKLACTVLSTEDGDKITIPNKEIVGQIVWNSAQHKVVEKTIGVSYNDNPALAIEVIRKTLKKIAKVKQEPAPIIGIESFGDSAIQIGIRYWVPTREYFHVMYEANLAIYQAFQEAKLTIPYPQQVVHLVPSK